jgi:hypothetical protein
VRLGIGIFLLWHIFIVMAAMAYWHPDTEQVIKQIWVLLELPGSFSLDGLRGAEKRQGSF